MQSHWLCSKTKEGISLLQPVQLDMQKSQNILSAAEQMETIISHLDGNNQGGWNAFSCGGCWGGINCAVFKFTQSVVHTDSQRFNSTKLVINEQEDTSEPAWPENLRGKITPNKNKQNKVLPPLPNKTKHHQRTPQCCTPFFMQETVSVFIYVLVSWSLKKEVTLK